MVAQGKMEPVTPLDNEELARRLEETADLLEDQDANPYRIRAYRTGADRLRELPHPAHEILRAQGRKGLMKLPGIGEGLSRHIEQLAFTGQFGLLDELRGDAGAEALLSTVSGIGHELAARIHRELGIESLEELERAAYDGRLARVPGFGARRLRTIRESLAARLGRRLRQRAQEHRAAAQPDVAEILDVDQEYRNKAEAGTLRTIAPRRFNPEGKAWLPVLHARRGDRHYTALFSNTAMAHQLGTTDDWVVIYRDDDGDPGQWTVVTAKTGACRGLRVVRGREQECAQLYAVRAEKARTLFDDEPAPFAKPR
jgi:hypothetical protein